MTDAGILDYKLECAGIDQMNLRQDFSLHDRTQKDESPQTTHLPATF